MSLEKQGNDDIKRKVCTGAFQLVFFTPELLIENKKWRKVLMSDVYTTRLKAFVVDEAHTVSKWYVSSHIHTAQIGSFLEVGN